MKFYSSSGGGSKSLYLALPSFPKSEREDLLIDVYLLIENSRRAATSQRDRFISPARLKIE
jgi:hypothetical protein